MNLTNFEKVKEFMNKMEQTVLEVPSVVEDKVCNLRINLIEEEVEETITAIQLLQLINKTTEETITFAYSKLVTYGKIKLLDSIPKEELLSNFNTYKAEITRELLREIADGLTDILVVTYGAGAAFGFDLDACFTEVHNSNMSKLGEDGKPIKRESDGKILKGPNYSPPDLYKVLFN